MKSSLLSLIPFLPFCLILPTPETLSSLLQLPAPELNSVLLLAIQSQVIVTLRLTVSQSVSLSVCLSVCLGVEPMFLLV
jgi:hypothetical protein